MARKSVPAGDAGEPATPVWFDAGKHRVEPRGIVATATGDLLAEDGLPVNAAARSGELERRSNDGGSDAPARPSAALAAPTEAPAEAPAEQE